MKVGGGGGEAYLLFTALAGTCVSKPLCKWIMIYLQLSDFFILISCNSDELTFFKHIGSEGRVGELQDVAGPHQVEPRLVLVHRVQDCLEKRKQD